MKGQGYRRKPSRINSEMIGYFPKELDTGRDGPLWDNCHV